jgi:hypothetical protein
MEKSKLIETEKGEAGEEQSQEYAPSFSITSRALFTNNSTW